IVKLKRQLWQQHWQLKRRFTAALVASSVKLYCVIIEIILTRKAHKNSLIINPLSAKSNFGSRSNFESRLNFGSMSWSRSMCVWLYLASPDVFVDSADGASSGLIR